jgi:hypothetical protein
MNSDSAIFCFGEEKMNSYEENEKCKDGAKSTILLHLCALRKDGARLLEHSRKHKNIKTYDI